MWRSLPSPPSRSRGPVNGQLPPPPAVAPQSGERRNGGERAPTRIRDRGGASCSPEVGWGDYFLDRAGKAMEEGGRVYPPNRFLGHIDEFTFDLGGPSLYELCGPSLIHCWFSAVYIFCAWVIWNWVSSMSQKRIKACRKFSSRKRVTVIKIIWLQCIQYIRLVYVSAKNS
jgi:hypothetical protein